MAFQKNTKGGGGGSGIIPFIAFVLKRASVVFLIQFAALAADPDPLQDFCVADMNAGVTVNGYPCKDRANVTSADFTFTGLRAAGNTSATGTGAVITYALVNQFPGLNTQGISHVRLDLAPGGVIPLHTHPLATETIFVVQGTISTGFISHENQLFSAVLQPGDLFIFPRGLLHFQENVGLEPAICFNSFNGQFPAILVSTNQILNTNISTNVLTRSFGASPQAISYLTSVLPQYWG